MNLARPESSVDVLVQFVNYNSIGEVGQCLEVLVPDLRQSGLTYRVGILDNSNDDMSGLQAKYNTEQFRFDRSPGNIGFGRGHNRIARWFNAGNLLLVNPDTRIIQAETVGRMFDAISVDESIKVIGPALKTPEGRTQFQDHGDPTFWRPADTNWTEHTKRTDVAWMCGAFVMIDKQAFDRLGGFDEDYFLYYEDADFGKRVRNTGGRVVYAPDIAVEHDAPSTDTSRARFGMDSYLKYLDKHCKHRPDYLPRRIQVMLKRKLAGNKPGE